MDGGSRRLTIASVALSVALLVLAGCFLSRALSTGYHQLVAPFSLGPAEFSNLETIKVIRAGANPYSPDVYAAPPLVFTGYTPLFHYLVALLPMPDGNPFFWGRLLAAGAMILTGLLPLLVAGRSGWFVGGLAVGAFFSLSPVALRVVFLRNDSLGLLLTALSVWMVGRADGRSARLAGAAVLAILAVFAKQSLVAAPIACGIYLLVADRRSFYRFAAAGLGVSLIVVASVQLGWGSGFWFSTILGPQHPMWLLWGLLAMISVLSKPLPIALVVSGALLAVREYRARGRTVLTGSPYAIYVLVSIFFLVAAVGKAGSGANYFVEPFLAMLMWMTHVLTETPRSDGRRAMRGLLATGLVVAGVCELALVPRPIYPAAGPLQANAQQLRLASVRSEVEALGFERPRVLGLADHPGLYRESDRVQLSYPAFYYWMWHTGLLDLSDMRERIAVHEFDVIIVPQRWLVAKERSAMSMWGYPLAMVGHWTLLDAVRESYRVAARGVTGVYFVPDAD